MRKLTHNQASSLIGLAIKEVEKHPNLRIGQAFHLVLSDKYPVIIEGFRITDSMGNSGGYLHDTWEIKNMSDLEKLVYSEYVK